MICRLHAGTLLGTLKFNSVASWEKDSDVLFHKDNFTAFRNLKPYIIKSGYKWVSSFSIVLGIVGQDNI